MRTRIKELPKNAVYDYTNVFGEKIYHTERCVYVVSEKTYFDKKVTRVYAYTKKEFYNN